MPTISSSGNMSPQSMTTMVSSYSTAVIFFPTEPTPPSGMILTLLATRFPHPYGVRREPSRNARQALRRISIVGHGARRHSEQAQLLAGWLRGKILRRRFRRGARGRGFRLGQHLGDAAEILD